MASSQSLTKEAKLRAWSIRYGNDGNPSLDVGGKRARMVMGVEYDAGSA